MLLEDVCIAVRLGCYDEGWNILVAAGARARHDAACLNLKGVICERARQWTMARKYYGRAMRADRRYQPAQQNMRRMYELFTLGRSDQSVALGDEKPCLMLLLAQREERRRSRIDGRKLPLQSDPHAR